MRDDRESVSGYWDRQADAYDQHFDHTIKSPAEQRAWDRIFNLVTSSRQALNVLDIGTGTGFLALAFAARGHRVTGIDLSPQMVKRARARAAEQGLAIAYRVGDGQSPPFPDTSFDLVISRHVFWSLPNKPTALTRWKRLLRSNGCLAILDGNWDLAATTETGDLASLTAEDVRTLIETHGFSRVKIDELDELSQALRVRAEQEDYPLPVFARYLAWGWVHSS